MADASPVGAPNDARPEIAQQKFACPACGAEAVWNPAQQALVCPFCGTQSPATLQSRGADTVIVEHDLVDLTEREAFGYVLDNLDFLVIKPAFPSQGMEPVFGGKLAAGELVATGDFLIDTGGCAANARHWIWGT